MQGLRVDWVFKNEGREFLYNISRSSNLEFYNVPFIQIIISYLFEKLQKVLRIYYLLQFVDIVVLGVTIAIYEGIAGEMQKETYQATE